LPGLSWRSEFPEWLRWCSFAGQSLVTDFDYYEIHEAFSGQVRCTLAAWDERYCQRALGRPKAVGSIDLARLNVNGGRQRKHPGITPRQWQAHHAFWVI
jgi:hypothetical protein